MPLADERRLSANTVARELAPAGRRSRPKTAGAFLQKNRCATEREQAPSPRVAACWQKSKLRWPDSGYSITLKLWHDLRSSIDDSDFSSP